MADICTFTGSNRPPWCPKAPATRLPPTGWGRRDIARIRLQYRRNEITDAAFPDGLGSERGFRLSLPVSHGPPECLTDLSRSSGSRKAWPDTHSMHNQDATRETFQRRTLRAVPEAE